jgi:GWxTD domain-containing protein
MKQRSIIVLCLMMCAVSVFAQTRREAQYAASKRLFVDALQANPDDLNALYNLSRLHLDMMEVDSAKVLLERAMDIEPNNAQFLVERGRVHLENPDKIDIGDARGYLEKAYEREPGLLTAKYYLAISWIYPVRGRVKLDEARALLDEVLNINPQYKDALFFYALCESQMNDGVLASGQYEAIIRGEPNHGGAGVRLAEIIFYGGGDPAQACGLYLAGLEHLQNPIELNRVAKETAVLFNREEQASFDAYPLHQRGRYLAYYWRAQDPTPGTLINERLHEQFKRLGFARQYYSTEQGQLGFDDRGMVFLKYGEPDDKYLGYHEMEFQASESWTYFSIDPDLAFDFVDRGGYFSHDLDLRDALVWSNPGDEGYWEQLQRMYRLRVDLGGIYARLGMKGMGYRGADHEFDNMIEAFVARRSRAITSVPPVKFVFDYESFPLDFLYQNGMFRSQEGATRFEMYYGIPLEDMKFLNQQGDLVMEPVQMNVTFSDMEYRPVQVFPTNFNVTFPVGVDPEKAFFVNQTAYDLPPGQYRIAISMEASESKLWGIYKDSIRVVDYTDDQRLAVSSIQMTPEITAPTIVNEKVYRGGYSAVPHPSMSFQQDEPSFVFYEIYNLTYGADGRTDYEVEMTLESIQRGGAIRSALGRLFSRRPNVPSISIKETGSSSTRSDRRATALDLSRVGEGDMLVTIKVTDNISEQAATSEQIFVVEKSDQ